MANRIDRLNLIALNVGCCVHDGDWNWKNVRSPFSRLYYVSEGHAQMELPSGIIDLKEGNLYFIPAYVKHSCICDSHFTHYYIHIYEDYMEGAAVLDEYELPLEVKGDNNDLLLMQRLCDINPTLKIPESNPESYDNHQTLMENFQKNLKRPFCDKVESRGILYILLSRFLAEAKLKNIAKDDRIRKIISYITRNLSKSLDIDLLADMACMSKVHFFRTFKEQTGETPNTFYIKKKLEKAELLLVASDLSVKTIASRLGYDDYSYFIRIFKKYSGLTPQQYREQKFENKSNF